MKYVITMIAITNIAILEICAIISGIDSGTFGVSIAAIAGLGGYYLAKQRAKPSK